MKRRVVVVGAGVTGSAVAAELAREGAEVTLVERGPAGRPAGSTGHAPGFVGLLGEAAVLTQLAQISAEIYEGLSASGEAGFDRVGGLEVARSATGFSQLERRAELARQAHLPARLLGPRETVQAAPDLVDPDGCVGGLLFERDGTARARVITAALQSQAAQAGVQFLFEATLSALNPGRSAPLSVRAGGQDLPADDVVLACGIWGQQAAEIAGVRVSLVPVAHPYVHGPRRQPTSTRSPFVRWPEHHVYARDHGDRFGLGSYDHVPVPVSIEEFGEGAELPWRREFEGVVDQALLLLPAHRRFAVEKRLNGVFAMTADNQPLLGPVAAVPGLWIAQALWVTHAAGAARCLTRMMTGGQPLVDGLDTLLPERFADQPEERLHRQSLELYRDIYATG